MSKQLSAYDRVAVLMAIEEKIFRACEPLREQGGPLSDGVRDGLKKAVAQLGKEDPGKLLSVLIRGACDSLSHDVIDKRVEKKIRREGRGGFGGRFHLHLLFGGCQG